METNNNQNFGQSESYNELKRDILFSLSETNSAIEFLNAMFDSIKDNAEFSKDEIRGYTNLVQILWDNVCTSINKTFASFEHKN